MRFHLLTVEATQQFGEEWRIAPSVPLRSLPPKLMMPMAGEEIGLRLPDGQVVTAVISGFGVGGWKDSEGNLHLSTDPSEPFANSHHHLRSRRRRGAIRERDMVASRGNRHLAPRETDRLEYTAHCRPLLGSIIYRVRHHAARRNDPEETT